MPVVTRELEIDYGGFVVGGSTDRLIDGYTLATKNFTEATIGFDLFIQKSTEEGFKTEIQAVEDAFRTPRQDLEIKLGAETIYSLKQSDNTGLDADPQIVKKADVGDTGRSRFYEVRISFGLPADNIGTSGRRDSRVDVSFSPSRGRTVTISGEYTALGSNSARDQYNASIGAYVTSVLVAIGGAYELVGEPRTEANDSNKTIQFVRTHREIIYNQSTAVLNDPDIVDQTLDVSHQTDASGDSRDDRSNRFVILTVNYGAWINKDNTTDIRGKWKSTIRPWLVNNLNTTLSGIRGNAGLAIIQENVDFDYAENRITATMIAQGLNRNGVIERTVSHETVDDFGHTLAPIWDKETGFLRHLFQAPASRQRIITHRRLVRGKFTPDAPPNLFGSRGIPRPRDLFRNAIAKGGFPTRGGVKQGPVGAGGGLGGGRRAGFIPKNHRHALRHIRYGIPPNQFDATEITETIILEWVILGLVPD